MEQHIFFFFLKLVSFLPRHQQNENIGNEKCQNNQREVSLKIIITATFAKMIKHQICAHLSLLIQQWIYTNIVFAKKPSYILYFSAEPFERKDCKEKLTPTKRMCKEMKTNVWLRSVPQGSLVKPWIAPSFDTLDLQYIFLLQDMASIDLRGIKKWAPPNLITQTKVSNCIQLNLRNKLQKDSLACSCNTEEAS